MNRIAAILLLVAVPWFPATGKAEDSPLYRAVTIVTGTGEENRARGFAECLAMVLVKVSGDPRLADDRRVVRIARDAASMVVAFSYRDRMAGIPVHDEQGTRERPHFLTVDFDPAKVDAALRGLRRKPWPEPRPQVAVSLEIRAGDVAYLLTVDGTSGRDHREALFDVAQKLGLPVILADGKEEAPATLTGSLVWDDATLDWSADWTLQTAGRTSHWTGKEASFDRVFREALGRTAQDLSGALRRPSGPAPGLKTPVVKDPKQAHDSVFRRLPSEHREVLR